MCGLVGSLLEGYIIPHSSWRIRSGSSFLTETDRRAQLEEVNGKDLVCTETPMIWKKNRRRISVSPFEQMKHFITRWEQKYVQKASKSKSRQPSTIQMLTDAMILQQCVSHSAGFNQHCPASVPSMTMNKLLQNITTVPETAKLTIIWVIIAQKPNNRNQLETFEIN